MPTEQNPVVVINADCLGALALLPGQIVSAVVTDPPYGTEGLGGGYGREHLTIECDESLDTVAAALPAVTRVLKPNSWFAMFSATKTRFDLETLLVAAGIGALGEVVWDKGAPGLGYHIRYAHETVLVRRWGKPHRPNDPLLSVYRHTARGDSSHPHEKPVGLMRRLIRWTTQPGDLILDPFAGSGTTGVAAVAEGRRAILVEREPKYAEICRRRVAEALGVGKGSLLRATLPDLFTGVGE